MQFSTLLTILPVLAASALAAPLVPRSAFNFAVWESSDCTGNGIDISGGANNERGNFGTNQFSIKPVSLGISDHITLYSGFNQQNVVQRFDEASVGSCHALQGELSWGVFAN